MRLPSRSGIEVPYGLWLLMAGVVGLFLIDGVFAFLEPFKTATVGGKVVAGNAVVDFLFRKKEAAVTALSVVMGAGIIALALSSWAKRAWGSAVKPAIDEGFEALKQSFSDDDIKNCVDRADPKELERVIRPFLAKIYGPHCMRDDSFVAKNISDLHCYFYDETPHKSSYSKHINLREDGDGLVRWVERLSYRVHCVALDGAYYENVDSELSPKFNVIYKSSASVPPIRSEEDLSRVDVTVNVDGVEVFNSREHLVYKDGRILWDLPGVVAAHHDGEVFFLHYEREVDLTKAWTDVKVIENTVTYDHDNTFALRTRGPICKGDMRIDIPEGWKFKQMIFGPGWDYDEDPEGTLIAETKEWIMPGIVAYCSWEKIDRKVR